MEQKGAYEPKRPSCTVSNPQETYNRVPKDQAKHHKTVDYEIKVQVDHCKVENFKPIVKTAKGGKRQVCVAGKNLGGEKRFA